MSSFSFHCYIWFSDIIGANMEHVRYTARGAVSLERLEEDANGELIYAFTTP